MLILEDDEDLRALLGDFLVAAGDAEVVSARSFTDLESQGTRVLACDLAILDINLGPGRPSGLDAYGWLRAHDFHGRTILLTGHGAAHPLVRKANEIRDVRVLRKPVDAATLEALARGESVYASGRPPP